MRPPVDLVGTTGELLGLAESIAAAWAELGAEGHLLARNLDSGVELGFAAERPVVLASVAKVPLALAALELVERGELDPAETLHHDPATSAAGPTGLARFRHPAQLALADALLLAITLSDNAAADLVLDRVGLAAVAAGLDRWGREDLTVRHRFGWLAESAAALAGEPLETVMEWIARGEADGAPALPALDPARASVGSARGCVELLAGVWDARVAGPAACRELRRLLGLSLFSTRLAGELRSDGVRVSGKTGSYLHLRHEIGVVESDAGDRVAIAALTRCPRPAALAPDLDAAIAAAARDAFEALRA